MIGEVVKTITKVVFWDWKANGWAYKWIFSTRDEKFFVHALLANNDGFVRVSVWSVRGWAEVYTIEAPLMKAKLKEPVSNPEPSRFEPDVGDAISIAFSVIGLR